MSVQDAKDRLEPGPDETEGFILKTDVQASYDDLEAGWVEAIATAENIVNLDSGKRAAVPVDRVVMYVGSGTPADWPAISGAVTGALFTSSSGEGLFSKDADWDLVGGSEDGGGDVDLDGYATEEYADAGDSSTLNDAKAYTDQQIADGIDGDISLDGYATVEAMEEGDTASVEAAAAYTDEAVEDVITSDDLNDYAKVDDQNYFTATQHIETASQIAMQVGGTDHVDKLRMFSDGAIQQLDDLANDQDDCLVTRKNLTDAVDGIDTYQLIVKEDGTAAIRLVTEDDQPNGYTQVEILGGEGVTVSVDEMMQSITVTSPTPKTYGDLAGTG